jgi:thiosulfate reductase cytochrome b subunit
VWNPGAFTDDGDLAPEYLTIAKPTNEACGQCHGAVHEGDDPLVGSSLADGWETLTSGQVFSPQRVAESGLNLPDKDELARPWDVHAERGLDCVSCHGALNNPAQVAESDDTKPDHLEYDPRRRDLGSYLEQPLHEFAKGHTAQGTVAPEYNHTMRTCVDCHDPQDSHEWLPFQERHMAQVACETCHIPASVAPAAEQYDWTVIHTDGTPRTAVRGADGAVESADTLITGFDPVILQRIEEDGSKRLAPYNLVGSWFWAHGTPERPVRLIDLEAAYLEGDDYAPDVVAAFDGDGDGDISEGELAIDDDVKEELIRSRLAARGLENPHIAAELQPYTIAHGITAGSWAIRDCQACHSSDSRLSQAMPVGAYVPGGVLPTFVGDSDTEATGSLHVTDDGRLWYEPETTSGDIEVLGNDRGGWADWIGFTVFMLVLIGIAIHGIIRVYTHYRRGPEHHTTRDAYLYTRYERFWRWTQALIIIMLILTGIVIHYPDAASAGTFRWMILVHNVLAVILVANAILALVDAVASGFIRQFLPRPAGFFHQAIVQATYYVQGIFRGDPHPYEKDERQKLNPLQQATYLAILNVLLPLQMITGILIWGAQRWPDVTSRLGGLGFLLPVHTLIAWLFAAFLVLHIYLTTTGVTPLASVRGMVTGWEEVEVQPADEDEQETEVVS